MKLCGLQIKWNLTGKVIVEDACIREEKDQRKLLAKISTQELFKRVKD